MKTRRESLVTAVAAFVLGFVSAPGAELSATNRASVLPVRGIHISAPAKRDTVTAVRFIRETLASRGVNTLVLQFDYGFDFKSRSEFANPSAPGKSEVREIVAACRSAGIELIPQISCLGHQSWAGHTNRLLEVHPELDETPGKYPRNTNIYCRTYCPLHPEVHKVMFDLIDELALACEAKSFHVGMDEVFILGDPDCPRCRGREPAQLFAGEVNTLQAHLKEIGCRMWMWADRFIDGRTNRIGKWEGSLNGTAPALDLVPKDIVMCDWHYEKAHDTPRYFIEKGFSVVACPWRRSEVALGQLELMRQLRGSPEAGVRDRALGMLHTTWCGFIPFVRACEAASTNEVKGAAAETARCFTTLFDAMR